MNENHALPELFLKYKETALNHRYINNTHIEPLLDSLPDNFKIEQIGSSVEKRPIYAVRLGNGKTKVLMWSQMHGNESTTTKALFDIFNAFREAELNPIMNAFELMIIPILNPDGAVAYTRHNANDIDLNRDATNQSQPETQALMRMFYDFQPDYCFNLHGQRTIFSAGHHDKPATLSFLAPAQDKACSITETRKKAMQVIVGINKMLQTHIPEQIGLYDDAFNLNCIGDTFQSHNVPTILFEAGHYKNDYPREEVRKLMFLAILTALNTIYASEFDQISYKSYEKIPRNQKLFCDLLLKNARLSKGGELIDIAIQYEERLQKGKICFIPKIEKIEKNIGLYGHKVLDCNAQVVLDDEFRQLRPDYEGHTVYINNELFSLNINES